MPELNASRNISGSSRFPDASIFWNPSARDAKAQERWFCY
jgi:hypothetical protein